MFFNLKIRFLGNLSFFIRKPWLILLFTCVSCISDEESQRQVNSGFQGKWVGTFSGGDSGTLTFIVDKEGTINGSYTSTINNTTESFEGYVFFNGKIDCNSKNGYSFTGYLDNVKPVNGQWSKRVDSNTVLTGTYKIHIQ